MANAPDQSVYYVPHNSWYPIGVAVGAICFLAGLGIWLNDVKAGEQPNHLLFLAGVVILTFVLFHWFGQVIAENQEGLNNPMLKRSYVWGMSWFIFSEVMFFAAFFGALFYARVLAVQWLGGAGDKGITGQYLWPDFKPVWPVMNNPDPSLFVGPRESMAAPGITSWPEYLPFWNTVILLSSSVTVHFAHMAIKNQQRTKIIAWLAVTVLLGWTFLSIQGKEYLHAYDQLGLTLHSGIYGSTFFILTGFHGFHVTLGSVILLIQLMRAVKGHFAADDCFGFEAASWYWHFVDVVWVCLFLFVYVL